MSDRHYSPIWNKIKAEGSCEITAHKALHPRIKKALRKEKDLDLGFKLECSERNPPVVGRIHITSSGAIIRFELHILPAITVDTI